MERDPATDHEPAHASPEDDETPEHPPQDGDRAVSVEEESEQSFPASDPPPY